MAEEADTPAAPAAADAPVAVHAIVVFSVLDHHLRRQEGQDRVIGTLLGTRDEATGAVEVTNAYAVPHTESGGEVAVGQQFNKTMFGLLSRVNAREEIVGWYATRGADGEGGITDASSLIHEFFARECEAPVHVVVDPRLEGDAGITVTAFRGARAGDDDAFDFAEVPSELAFDEGERCCLRRMIDGQKEPFAAAESVAAIAPAADDGGARADVDDLLAAIDDVVAYADAQKAKGAPVDPKVARAMDEALATLPKIDRAIAEGALQDETQDVLMVSYLASITKAQLAIAAKIHESF